MKKEDLKKVNNPIGEFILNNASQQKIVTHSGTYYYYGDVCSMLRKHTNQTIDEAIKLVGEMKQEGKRMSPPEVTAYNQLSNVIILLTSLKQ